MKLSLIRSSPPKVFSKKDTLQTWSKFTVEKQCRSAISTKSLCNFNKMTPTHRHGPKNSQHICRTPWTIILLIIT